MEDRIRHFAAPLGRGGLTSAGGVGRRRALRHRRDSSSGRLKEAETVASSALSVLRSWRSTALSTATSALV